MKNPDSGRDTLQIFARVDRNQIAYLSAIIDSYEGLAVMRTLDPAQGIVSFYVCRPLYEQARALLQSLQQEIGFEFIDPPRDQQDI
ncbi:MAG: DUF4911 domain-containing protein [bacterium]